MSAGFAPREVFDQILEWAVIPTFDLVFKYGEEGYVMVKRTIAPYKNVWAFPGLRMYKGETIDQTLGRIAEQELGIRPELSHKVLIGQYVGKFSTEHSRQDISSGYLVRLRGDEKLVPNPEHFSDIKIVKVAPLNTGAMYRYYLEEAISLES